MPDPFTLGAAGGALNLTSTLLKIHQEHARDPKRAPGFADIMRTIPGAAFEATGKILAELDRLEVDCKKAKLDLNQTFDQLWSDTWVWKSKRYRLLQRFERNMQAMSSELAALFDDVVAIANCSESEDLVAKGYKQALERKNVMRRDTSDDKPIGEVLRGIRRHAEELRAEIGDMGNRR